MVKKSIRLGRIKASRLEAARRQLPEMRSLASFHKVRIATSDADQHWQFHCGRKFLLSYWPAVGKAKRVDGQTAVKCTSPQQALRLMRKVLATLPTKPTVRAHLDAGG